MNDPDRQWMLNALAWAGASEDPSVQNGAIIIDLNGHAIAAGHNGPTRGIDPENPSIWVRPEKYMWIEHAERNAIFHAVRNGRSTENATMYCPWASCADCARAIVQSGITRLVRYPMIEADGWVESLKIGDKILLAGGVEILEIEMHPEDILEGLRLGQFRDV